MNEVSQRVTYFTDAEPAMPDPAGPKHDARVQGNRLSNFHVNPLAGYINAPSTQALDVSAFVKPGQPDWFVGRHAPIKALKFRRRVLHRLDGPSAESRKRYD